MMGMRYWCEDCTAVFKTLRGARFHERWTEHGDLRPLQLTRRHTFHIVSNSGLVGSGPGRCGPERLP